MIYTRLQSVIIQTKFSRPKCQTLCFSLVSYHLVVSFIVGLFCYSGPSKVAGEIAFRIVNSIKSMLFARSWWNVRQKVFKFEPRLMYFDSSAAIIFPSMAGFASTSLNYIVMRSVEVARTFICFMTVFEIHQKRYININGTSQGLGV